MMVFHDGFSSLDVGPLVGPSESSVDGPMSSIESSGIQI